MTRLAGDNGVVYRSEGTVTGRNRSKSKDSRRAIVAAGAVAGWVVAMTVTVAAPFVEWADDRPFFVSRIFALFALAATVLSIAWLIDRAKRPSIPVPAETTYEIGIEVGKDIGRMEATLQQWNAPPAGPPRHPLAGDVGEQRDTPPYMWRR